MHEERMVMFSEIERLRNSKVMLYATSDRRNMETKIASDVLPFFINHLDSIGDIPKISLILYTQGGETLVAWSLVNLIRNFCKDFEVIIPFHCHSAGTLISLGADRIIMTKQATLGPIDPSVNGIMNPQVVINNQQVKVPVNVEFINGYLEMAREDMKITSDVALANILTSLSNQIHPLSLGEVQRSRAQIQMLARKLLKYQKMDKRKQEAIIKFLCKESGSHDYTIYRKEAHEELGLNIEKPNDELYALIKGIYADVKTDMQLDIPFDPQMLVSSIPGLAYSFTRAIIESIPGGCDRFLSEGNISKQIVPQQIPGPGPMPLIVNQTLVQDSRNFEGWRHQ